MTDTPAPATATAKQQIEIKTCPVCGTSEGLNSDLIRAIEYYPNGTVKRVEYRDWPEHFILQRALEVPVQFTPWDRLRMYLVQSGDGSGRRRWRRTQ
jgi:hypothetical protein